MAEALARKIRPVRRSVQKRGGIRSKCAVHVERDVSPLLNASAQLAGAVRDGRRRSLTRDFQKQEPRLFATWWTTYNPVDYSEEQFPGNSSSSISLVCCFALCKKKLFLAIGSQSQCSSLEVEEQILAKTISLPPSLTHSPTAKSLFHLPESFFYKSASTPLPSVLSCRYPPSPILCLPVIESSFSLSSSFLLRPSSTT